MGGVIFLKGRVSYRNFCLRGERVCVYVNAWEIFYTVMPIFGCIIPHVLVSSLYCGLVCIEGCIGALFFT